MMGSVRKAEKQIQDLINSNHQTLMNSTQAEVIKGDPHENH
jgi:hypothetical protein